MRSWDRAHTLELLAKGVDYELRETYELALAFGAETLRGIGFAADEADDVVADVRRRDADRLAVQLSGDATAGVAGHEAERGHAGAAYRRRRGGAPARTADDVAPPPE